MASGKLKLLWLAALVMGLEACAGTVGQPEAVQRILTSKYVGQSVQSVIVDLGAPSSEFDMGNGAKALTWRRDSAKYANTNVIIKSDERCVVTMLTNTSGSIIASVGKVDDSLGAFNFSYCKEQLGL